MPVLKGPADPCSQKYDCVWLLLPEMRQLYGLLRQMLGPEARGCEHPTQALELKSLILGFPHLGKEHRDVYLTGLVEA